MISISLRVFGNDVFYSNLNQPEHVQQLFKSSQNDLEKQVQIARHFLLSEKFRQPLVNGFEFASSLDFSYSSWTKKQSDRSIWPKKLDYLNSLTFIVDQNYEVQINKENKLGLNYRNSFNTNLKLVSLVEAKGNGIVYTWNVQPVEKIPLITFEY